MDNEFICDMLDCYEGLLTDNQRQIMTDYYRYDTSLNEIAENLDISKQGVKDTRDKALQKLDRLEACLGLARKKREWRGLRAGIADKVVLDFVDGVFSGE